MYVDDPRFNPAAREDGPIQPLSDDEIDRFVSDINKNNDEAISYSELETMLDNVARELNPALDDDKAETSSRHLFLRQLLGTEVDEIPVAEFKKRVKSWRIPSLKQETDDDTDQDDYIKKMGAVRRLQSYWAVHGPMILFCCIVGSMMLAFGVWQLVKYLGPAYRGALGWGVVVAKTCAGLLYPTLFFLLLSMARYLSTMLRMSYSISRFVNFDLSQNFHIYMAVLATFLGTVHGIAHLTGDFIWIANSYRPEQLQALLGDGASWGYRDLIKSRAGLTGIIALASFWTIGLLSLPWVRRKSYEVFQLGHLLMYPIIGCLMAHGTQAILQWPMLGYFLAFPTLLVLTERATRLVRGFLPIKATIRILDSETVSIKAEIPQSRLFPYQPGHYIFLQVPKISRWQWHPFTVSTCLEREIQLHIKTDGNWTKNLRALATEDEKPVSITIGVDGPFGAPAQRFYDFSHTILVGSGIGVTPFAGILADLQSHEDAQRGGPDEQSLNEKLPHPAPTSDKPLRPHGPRSDSTDGSAQGSETVTPRGRSRSLRRASFPLSRIGSRRSSRQRNAAPDEFPADYRRVDVHWVARSRQHLAWFAELLNNVQRSQDWHAKHDGLGNPHLDIRIKTHVSMKRPNISTHVFRWLLELHRTDDHPNSPLTGLVNPTHYGRPNFVQILDEHYEDMKKYHGQYGYDVNNDGKTDRFKVGVFFCGAPVVGEVLADRCRALTARGRAENTLIEYYFMMEVFG
ncbi:hypothetical protein CC85DRAFT_287297 [Cutaneotrichosporon oleaginosum]|uniref:FAD-binding FR-type domain-containing protein n=1 Tax=Cutaneotrichosporon oleaginosum TaxID=879819 RepID=A0A0J0XHJ7_9TREE|nr:uncharacterized protein CC85DRAFT_287297 [Cutaneotrichosporon oleaginosum]KLT40571.1 hypothetical protein CC85DRAFT_287297 [Cutaneotrichosporon oleaginosum]